MRGRRGIRAVTVTLGVFTGDDPASGFVLDAGRGVTARLLRR
jgi:hypothetical protein